MLILAPMQGLTELLFRKAFFRFFPDAFDYAISPFLSLTSGNIRYATSSLTDVWPSDNELSIPVVPQILGVDPQGFIDLANRLADLGYSEVNWNIGCPMRRIAAKHRGSGILPFPDEIHRFLDKVFPNLSISLSLKMRLGYRLPDEIIPIIPILNQFPIKNITLHPRIGKQMYNGLPDWDRFEAFAPLFSAPLIGNGDINSVNDYARFRQRFPHVKHVMIGRGTLFNPLLPLQIKSSFPSDFEPFNPTLVNSTSDNKSLILQFIYSLFNDIRDLDIREESKVRKIKEYWCLLSKALPGSESQKRFVLYATSLDDIIDRVFSITQ